MKSALSAVTAAVVGVISNLALWFALHVFFRDVELVNLGPFQLWSPNFTTLDWRVVVLSVISGYLLLGRHWSIAWVLLTSSALAVVIRFTAI